MATQIVIFFFFLTFHYGGALTMIRYICSQFFSLCETKTGKTSFQRVRVFAEKSGISVTEAFDVVF